MIDTLFTDGIGSIAVIGGAVRIDLMALAPEEKDAEGRPKILPVKRIIMTPEGFLRSSEKIKEAAEALSKLAIPHDGTPAEATTTGNNGHHASMTKTKHSFP